jgi:L-2-hydroxyglutarate oxidase LhgO
MKLLIFLLMVAVNIEIHAKELVFLDMSRNVVTGKCKCVVECAGGASDSFEEVSSSSQDCSSGCYSHGIKFCNAQGAKMKKANGVYDAGIRAQEGPAQTIKKQTINPKSLNRFPQLKNSKQIDR